MSNKVMKDDTGQAINTTLQSLVGAISPSARNVSFDNTGCPLTTSTVELALKELSKYSNKTINTTYGNLTLQKSGCIVTVRWQGNATALPNDTILYSGQTALSTNTTITFDIAISQSKRGYIAITSNGIITATGLNDGSVTYTQGTISYICNNYNAIV